MPYKMRDRCAVVVTHGLTDAFVYLDFLNNRGQDTSGIARMGDDGIDVLRWGRGTLDRNSVKSLLEGRGPCVGHNKYTTVGSKDPEMILEAAHPIYMGNVLEEFQGDHIMTYGADSIISHNGQVDIDGYDSSRTGCDTERLLKMCADRGVEEVIRMVPHAFSAAYMDRSGDVTVFRDGKGVKPLFLGKDDKRRAVVASEDYAMLGMGHRVLREVNPGEMVVIHPDGNFDCKQVVDPDPRPCTFEWVYLMNDWDPERAKIGSSSFYGVLVNDVRRDLGRECAREYPFTKADWDIVCHLPNSPYPAAVEYSKLTGIPFARIFYKTGKRRAFMQRNGTVRRSTIAKDLKLNTNPKLRRAMRNKRVLIIDDSLVRSTNARHAVKLSKEVGRAKQVGLILYNPLMGGFLSSQEYEWLISDNGRYDSRDDVWLDDFPFGSPEHTEGKWPGCYKGVDMPSMHDFATVIYGRNPKAIADAIGLDFLGYLSLGGMDNAIPIPRSDRCTTCFTGEDF